MSKTNNETEVNESISNETAEMLERLLELRKQVYNVKKYADEIENIKI